MEFSVGDYITSYYGGVWLVEEVIPAGQKGGKPYSTLKSRMVLNNAWIEYAGKKNIRVFPSYQCKKLVKEDIYKDIAAYISIREAAVKILFGEELVLPDVVSL